MRVFGPALPIPPRTYNFQDVRSSSGANCTITYNAYAYDNYTGALPACCILMAFSITASHC
jgi:hypothetical protein